MSPLYCVGRFWVELLRDDTATHIAGIRINSFTSTFVFIGAVVYIILAPKGREDPESLRGNDDVADESAESEPEVEPAGELASVAAASAATTATAASDGRRRREIGEGRDRRGSRAEEPEVEDAKAEAVEAAEPEAGSEAEGRRARGRRA